MTYDPLHVASYYAALFPARTDVYSRWTAEGWRPVREPLTGEIVLAGLSGTGPSISGYMIAPGSVAHVLALDFDTDNGLDQAFTLARFMAGDDIPSYVETSRRGAHLWCVIDDVLPARLIRAAARGLLQSAGLPDDPHIEVRPGSDRISDDGLGHALRLPMMPHPKTGKRGRLMYPTGTPVGRTVGEVLLAMEWTDADRLRPWAERWKRPPTDYIPPSHRRARQPSDDDDASASEILGALWGVPNAAPGRVVSCPAKEYHSRGDVHKGLKIMPDDRRVICYKAGCILNKDGHGRGTYELRTLAPAT